MRMLVGAVLATALLGSASIAYAADATGKDQEPGYDQGYGHPRQWLELHGAQEREAFRLQGRREGDGELHQDRRQDGRHVDQACDLTTAIAIGVFECEPPVLTGGFAR